MRGITPDDFHKYNAFYIGNHQVIFTPNGDAKIAHPSSFEALDDGLPHVEYFPYSYGRDAEYAYFFTGSTETRHAVKLKGSKEGKSPKLYRYCCLVILILSPLL